MSLRERFLEQIQFAFVPRAGWQIPSRAFAETKFSATFKMSVPAFGIRRLERRERAMMFRGGNQFEQLPELDSVLRPDLRVGDFAGGGLQSGERAQFVARKNRLERDRRLRALMRDDVRVQRSDDFVAAGLFIRQIGCELENSATTSMRAFKPFAARKSASSGLATTFPAPEKPPAPFFSTAR
jgi:hypothetical protein